MGLTLRKYCFVCPKGHKWIRETYGGPFNWSRCPHCGLLGVVCHAF